MGASTLSKLQMEQYKEIVERFGNSNTITLVYPDAIRLDETLTILEQLGYIKRIETMDSLIIAKLGNFSDFDAWHKDRVREEKKLSGREWKIAIFSALMGLLPFIFTTVIPWLISLFTTNG